MEPDEENRQSAVGATQIRNLVEFKRYEARLQVACQYDFEKVLLQFATKSAFSFSVFSEIWKESNLNLLFAGQQYGDDIGKFTEICMYAALKLFLFPKNIYTEVGAFYLLYALYYRQPLKDFVKIRLTHTAFKNLKKLVEKMRAQKQYEFLYIYGKLRIVKAFQYVATVTPIGITFNEMNLQEVTPDTFINRKTDLTERVTNLITENLDDIRQIQSEYMNAVRQFSLEYPEQDISCFDSNFVQDIEQLEGCVNSAGILHTAPPSDNVTPVIESRKLQIKKRAFREARKSHRERLGDKSAKLFRSVKNEPSEDDPDDF